MTHRTLKFIFTVGVVIMVFIGGIVTLSSRSAQADTPPDGFSFISTCGNVQSNVILAADISAPSGDCLTVGNNGVTIDGNGFRITTVNGKAVNIIQKAGTTLRNLLTDSGIQIYGADAHSTLIENSRFGSLGIYYGADDTTVRNNHFGSIAALAEHPSIDPIQRITLTNNVIESASNKILWIQTGVGKAGQDPALFPCLNGEHAITDNILISHFTGDATSEPAVFTLRCSSHDTIRGNTMIADGEATGIYLRDEANNSTYENNSVWTTSESSSGPLFSGGGWNVYGQPSFNVFRNNTFHSSNSRAVWLQGIGDENVFEHNVFYSNYWEGGRIAGGGGNTFDHNTFYNAHSGNAMVFDNLRPPANVYTNNIFEYDGSSGKRVFEFDHVPDFAGYSANHNVYFNRNGNVLFQDPAHGTAPGWTLGDWMLQTGETASIEGDPLFTDPGAYDFTIGSDSVARGADAAGGDAGAFPYSSGTPDDATEPGRIIDLEVL